MTFKLTKGVLGTAAALTGLAFASAASADASPRSYLDIQAAEYTFEDDGPGETDASGFQLELDAVIGGSVSFAVEHADLETDDTDASIKFTEYGITYHRAFGSTYRLGVSGLLNNFELGGAHDDGFSIAIDNDFVIAERFILGARLKYIDLGDDFERTAAPADSIDTGYAVRLAATFMITDGIGINLKAEQTKFDNDSNDQSTSLVAGIRLAFPKGD